MSKIGQMAQPAARFNTDGWRFFAGTMVQTWFPIVWALGYVDVEKETFASIQTAMVVTINSFFAVVKSTPAQ